MAIAPISDSSSSLRPLWYGLRLGSRPGLQPGRVERIAGSEALPGKAVERVGKLAGDRSSEEDQGLPVDRAGLPGAEGPTAARSPRLDPRSAWTILPPESDPRAGGLGKDSPSIATPSARADDRIAGVPAGADRSARADDRADGTEPAAESAEDGDRDDATAGRPRRDGRSGAAAGRPDRPSVRELEDRLAALLAEKAGGERRRVADTSNRSAEVSRVLASLKARDAEVRAHEAAHVGAGGRYVRGAASYSYQNGPDGRQYAVGGEVGIDASPVPGKPEETLAKMAVVRAAALAPAEPSGADLSVAAGAAQAEAAARAEIAASRAEELRGMGEAPAKAPAGASSDAEAAPGAESSRDATAAPVGESASTRGASPGNAAPGIGARPDVEASPDSRAPGRIEEAPAAAKAYAAGSATSPGKSIDLAA